MRTGGDGGRPSGTPGATPMPVSSPLLSSDGGTPMPATASSLQGFGTTVGNGASNGGQPALQPAPSGSARGVLIGLGAAAALGLGGLFAYRTLGTPPQLPPQPAALSVAPRRRACRRRAEAAHRQAGGAAGRRDRRGRRHARHRQRRRGGDLGAIGSVHKVRIKSGDAEILKDVVVTEGGAIPPKVELSAQPGAAVKPLPLKGPIVKPTVTPTAPRSASSARRC